MDIYKLKVKLGDHEFEAEGPVEVVKAQFASFKELIASLPTKKEETKAQEKERTQDLALDKIMKAQDRVVSLTAQSNSVEDAVLLILLGQKSYRNNDSITGGEVMDGLKESGHTLTRVDRILGKLASQGLLIIVGRGRGRKYRLTNQGMNKAKEIATEVISLVA